MTAQTNAQPWLSIRLLITDDFGLTVEVNGPEVLVRSPRGSFGVTYKKSPDAPQLVLKSEWLKDGRENPIRLGLETRQRHRERARLVQGDVTYSGTESSRAAGPRARHGTN
jgi:hypothetical protein